AQRVRIGAAEIREVPAVRGARELTRRLPRGVADPGRRDRERRLVTRLARGQGRRAREAGRPAFPARRDCDEKRRERDERNDEGHAPHGTPPARRAEAEYPNRPDSKPLGRATTRRRPGTEPESRRRRLRTGPRS